VSKYPISNVCPKCESAQYKTCRSEELIAFASDRICTSCGTRYVPPTPRWAGVIFIIIGLIMVAFAPFAILTRISVFNLLGVPAGLFGLLAIGFGIRALWHRGSI